MGKNRLRWHRPRREDDTERNIRYNGHPPECKCVECTNRKLAQSKGLPFDEEEKDWVSTKKDCDYCHNKQSQMWNEKEKKIGCLNLDCIKFYEYL